MSGYKVRLADGSEIGPMDLQAIRNWYAQGLLESDSPVLKPGTTKWTTLSQAIDLIDLRPSRRPGGGRAVPDEDDDGEEYQGGVSYAWPMRAAAVLCLLAALAAGWLWLHPTRFTPALDQAPWREIALGFLASCLLLARAWGFGRRLVQLVSLLAACALPPLMGILVVDGVRGAPLLAMGCASACAFGLFLLITVWPRRWWKPTLAALVMIAGGVGVGYFGLVRDDARQQHIAQWAAPERAFKDDAGGFALSLPGNWRILRAGQTVVAAPAGVRHVLGEVRLGGYGYVIAEDAPRGVQTADEYLAGVLARWRQAEPGLRESGRREVRVGSLRGRAAEALWTNAAGGAFRGLAAAWRNGWTYVGLVAWVADDGTPRPAAELDALLRGLTLDAARSGRFAQAVEAAVREVPLLSPAAAELMISQAPDPPVTPASLFARTFRLAAAGASALTPDEARERDVLLATAVAAVLPRERPRVIAYVERLRQAAAEPSAEDEEAAQLLRPALLQLTSEQLTRAQELHERAIRAAVAHS